MRAIVVAGLLAACTTQPAPADLATELPAEWLDEGIGNGHGTIPLVVDPDTKDGITALAECAGSVSVCLERTSGDFDKCMRQAPSCKSDEPWDEETACCPSACVDQFEALTKAGSSGFDAYIQVMVIDGSCIPTLEPRSEG